MNINEDQLSDLENGLSKFRRRGVGNAHYEAVCIPQEKLIGVDGRPIELKSYIGEYAAVGKFLVFIDLEQNAWIIPYFSSAVRLELLREGYIEDCRDVDDLNSPTLSSYFRLLLENDPEIEEVYQALIDDANDIEDELPFERIADKAFTYMDKITEGLRIKSNYKMPLFKAKLMAFICAMPFVEGELQQLAREMLKNNTHTSEQEQ